MAQLLTFKGLGNAIATVFGYAGDVNALAVTVVDSNGVSLDSQPTQVATSGNVANATAAATFAAVAAKTNYLSGFAVTGLGATVGGVAVLTVTGLAGGTITFQVPIVAGALLGLAAMNMNFNPPLQASAVNTAISVSLAALGAGNTNVVVTAWGLQK